MNILILGSGGREHAFAWKIRQSANCDKLYVAPGNAGTAQIATNISIDIMDFSKVERAIRSHSIDMVLVGPEAPLVAGIVDYLSHELPSVRIIGPGREGAQIEGSKIFAKEFMVDNQIPTAAYVEVTESTLSRGIEYLRTMQGPYVLKADGLAGGKGVIIVESREEAIKELKEMIDGKFGDAGTRVVIEQFLSGLEFSVFVLTDGQYYTLLPEAKDYKRIGEGDTGLNTGGMGAISPVSFVDAEMMRKVKERIILPTLSGLQKRDIDYVGFIFFGLIEVQGEPYLIEYNCRMGDPETEVVFPRISNDIVEMFEALHTNELYEIRLETDPRAAATIMLVSGGYPQAYETGNTITIEEVIDTSILFHAATIVEGTTVKTNGGRVIAVTSLANTTQEAVAHSLKAADKIQFKNSYFRRDIGFDLY